jgi:hypothetical protein
MCETLRAVGFGRPLPATDVGRLASGCSSTISPHADVNGGSSGLCVSSSATVTIAAPVPRNSALHPATAIASAAVPSTANVRALGSLG